jgi:hypothetical protein
VGTASQGTNNITLHRNGLPAGLYFYQLEVKGNRTSGRFTIQP